MTKRIVTLGCGRKVGLGAYVKAWQRALDAPADARFNGSPSDSRLPSSRDEVLREFRDGMHDRINRHISSHGRGRKWHSDWQRQAIQLALAVNTPRLIVRWAPLEFRARLAHRLEV